MKHILVHIDASERSAARLALAQQLATRHQARLTAFYGVLPGLLASAWPTPDGMMAIASQWSAIDQEQLARARTLVAQAAARLGEVAPRWVDGGESPYWRLLAQAPYADLLVLGQHDGDDPTTGALPPDLVPSALCDTGRPALLVPRVGSFGASAPRVLIAWKPSREAARALGAALPWLLQAEGIDVAQRAETQAVEFDHMTALQEWLHWQGVRAPVQRHRLGPGDIGEQLLSLAADAASSLLVMGGYGHSRAREWVLGGATRTVLKTMTLPVLMAH